MGDNELYSKISPIANEYKHFLALFVGHGRRNRGGAQGARAPPIILPSEIFLTQYALLSRKSANKMFIFNKIFWLASLANQDIQEIYKFKRSNYVTSLILKVPVLVQNIQKVRNQLFNTQSPSLIFKIIGYNFNTIQDIPVPKSQGKELL